MAFYKLGDATVDYKTGVRDIPTEDYHVKKLLAFPHRVFRESKVGSLARATNRFFAFGGYYDTSVKVFVVEESMLPKACVFGTNDWLIHNHVKYEIQSYEFIDEANIHVIVGQATLDEDPDETIVINMDEVVGTDDASS